MLDTPNYTPEQAERLRRFFHSMNYFMVGMWKIGLGKLMNVWPAVGGRIMVIRHHGRKTGKEYLTPVNYAIVDGEIYCLAGFGPKCDWYRNIMAAPRIQLWLPEGKREARAGDVSGGDSQRRARLLREIIIASGFAGPLLGVDQRKFSDEELLKLGKDYLIVHFAMEG
jgi:deazaflavin-dependent oxidoreductase (nitroreductase family)